MSASYRCPGHRVDGGRDKAFHIPRTPRPGATPDSTLQRSPVVGLQGRSPRFSPRGTSRYFLSNQMHLLPHNVSKRQRQASLPVDLPRLHNRSEITFIIEKHFTVFFWEKSRLYFARLGCPLPARVFCAMCWAWQRVAGHPATCQWKSAAGASPSHLQCGPLAGSGRVCGLSPLLSVERGAGRGRRVVTPFFLLHNPASWPPALTDSDGARRDLDCRLSP